MRLDGVSWEQKVVGVAYIGNGATLEILGTFVDGTGKSGHGVHGTSSVQNVDILLTHVSC